MSTGPDHTTGRSFPAMVMVLLMIGVVITPLAPPSQLLDEGVLKRTEATWEGNDQPWPQYARTPTHNQTVPDHGPDGGPGQGSVENVSTLGTLEHPGSTGFPTNPRAMHTVINGDFSATWHRSGVERRERTFSYQISSELSDGSRESFLNIISGNDAKIAWRVSLGTTEAVRSTPMIHDIDGDEHPEVVVVYDTQGALNIDVWSPRLTCTESNWQTSGHSNELLWSYSDADVRIGSPSPHFATANSDHSGHTTVAGRLESDCPNQSGRRRRPTTILVKVNAYTLTARSHLRRIIHSTEARIPRTRLGTTRRDDNLRHAHQLTAIQGTWIWKIDGSTGSLDWNVAIQNGTIRIHPCLKFWSGDRSTGPWTVP